MLWMGITEANAPLKYPNLPNEFSGNFKDKRFQNPKVFLPGVLVVKGSTYAKEDALAERLLQEDLGRFHYVFLVDDSEDAIKSDSDFIWTIFTRMEPASDVYARTETKHNHISYQVPIVFDCRMKPWIPEVLVPLSETVKQVDSKFGRMIDIL